MNRELLLLRHGKSDWSVDSDDFNRPLKERGKRGAQRIGFWLRQQQLLPDLVISSPAKRAKVSAQLCSKAMGLEVDSIIEDEAIYLAEVDELLRVLGNCPPQTQRVMLVGHNPGLEFLLIHLASKPLDIPADGKLLPTSAVARLAMPDDWHALKKGQCQLMHIQRAADLPEKYPFATQEGEELRERPAFYYSQASAIPFRINKEKLEILAIRKNQQQDWSIPKAVVDPGLSPQQAAGKKAMAKADIEGVVAEESLGSYDFKKWGATCTVAVYPMLVTKQHKTSGRQQPRERQWFSAAQAIKQVKPQAVRDMIGALEKIMLGD